jgi:predicted ATP-dependent endonuclease of OLD family
MYISEIRIAKFRHIENVVIGPLKFNSKSSETFVFAGPNGGGKSSILELISYALSNSYSLGWNLSRTFEGFSFEVAIGLAPDEISEILNGISNELHSLFTEREILEKAAEQDRIKNVQFLSFKANQTHNVALIRGSC